MDFLIGFRRSLTSTYQGPALLEEEVRQKKKKQFSRGSHWLTHQEFVGEGLLETRACGFSSICGFLAPISAFCFFGSWFNPILIGTI